MSKLQKEVWKDIPNYEGHYQVSNLGRVKSLRRKLNKGRKWKEKILSSTLARGYEHITLSVNAVPKTMKVHRLVLLAFVGKSDLYVNHKNGVKTDNRLENLEYCTNQQNMDHAVEMGLIKKGTEVNTNKLTEQQAKEIKYENKGLTQKQIGAKYNVSPCHVSQIRLSKTWKHI